MFELIERLASRPMMGLVHHDHIPPFVFESGHAIAATATRPKEHVPVTNECSRWQRVLAPIDAPAGQAGQIPAVPNREAVVGGKRARDKRSASSLGPCREALRKSVSFAVA